MAAKEFSALMSEIEALNIQGENVYGGHNAAGEDLNVWDVFQGESCNHHGGERREKARKSKIAQPY